MDQPIYSVTVQRLKEAFHQIDPDEASAYIKKNIELLKQANGEMIVQLYSATPDAWMISVMKYPDVESAMKAKIIWTQRNQRYVETKTYFGYEPEAWQEIMNELGLNE